MPVRRLFLASIAAGATAGLYCTFGAVLAIAIGEAVKQQDFENLGWGMFAGVAFAFAAPGAIGAIFGVVLSGTFGTFYALVQRRCRLGLASDLVFALFIALLLAPLFSGASKWTFAIQFSVATIILFGGGFIAAVVYRRILGLGLEARFRQPRAI